MKKIIHKSPWGDFVTLKINGREFNRTAQGGLWSTPGIKIPFIGYSVLDWLMAKLPADEVLPDDFSPKMQWLDQDVHTDKWAES